MRLESLRLVNFKSYEKEDLTFSTEIICLVGDNGIGKTNLLDAIHYLALGKSAFYNLDNQNIRHDSDLFVVEGLVIKEGKKYNVQCSLKRGQKKALSFNKVQYDRISEHVGVMPVVLMAPYDTDLIRGGSEGRRKFFDGLIAQIDRPYLESLISYTHILKQRNSLLKQFAERKYFDKDLLHGYNTQLIKFGKELHKRRFSFLEKFRPVFLAHYHELCDEKEVVDLQYRSQLRDGEFEILLENSLKRDLIMQRTHVGAHRDDYPFVLDDHDLKKLGSQGQQKSYMIALKLAQFDLIKEAKGYKPLLLLDDIFDKLDDKRITKLMKMVTDDAFGQLFVTDARPERTERIFKQLGDRVSIFEITEDVEKNIISQLKARPLYII